MRRRVLILEDLEIARKAIVDMVRGCGEDLIVYDFGDSANALECAMANKIDLFLVDIVLKPQLPNDSSGITFAEMIRGSFKYAAAEIIFITTLAGLEAELLRSIHCFDYIEKPISRERVQKVVKEALYKIEGKPKKDEVIFLRKDRVTYPVNTDEIIYLESRRKILYVYAKDETVDIPNLSLKKILEKIQTQEFLYPTKGIAINVKHIEYVDMTNRFVKMRGVETLINIGERMREQFLTKLYKYGDVDRR